MKVAISTDQGFVSAHFGRCPTYTLFDIQGGKVISQEEIPNPGHQPGFLPQYLSEKGINCIIAGGMGPRAQSLFAQANIETIIGVQGSIDEVIQKYINQELESGEDLCGHAHGQGHQCAGHHPSESTPIPPGAKICLTATGKDLNSEIDPKFGRAAYFLLLDPIVMRIEAIENPHKDAMQGAGIKSAQSLVDHGVKILLTGDVGPKANAVLQSAGIQTITGVSGKIQDAIQNFAKEVK